MEFFTHTVNGADLKFAHFTLYDVFGDPSKPEPNGFVPIYRKRCKAKLLDNMRALELDKGQQLTELITFDTQPVSMATFLKYVGSDPLALVEVLSASFKAANNAPLPTLSEMEQNEVFWKLVKPLGIEPASQADADPEPKGDSNATFGDGGDEPNPLTIPPVFSATLGADSALTTEMENQQG